MQCMQAREDRHLPRNVIPLLVAVGLGMHECGVEMNWASGVEKAVKIMKELKTISILYIDDHRNSNRTN